MCGQSSGALEVIEALRTELDRLGITARLDEVGCLGICYAEPLVDVLRPGTKSRLFFGNVTPEDVPEIVSAYITEGRVAAGKALGFLGEEPIDGVPDLSELPGIKLQNRIALRNAGHIAPGDIHQYIANGGYSGIHKALTEMEPDDVIKAMSDSGLRGRGGAAFPTGVKWSFMVRSPGPPKYMLCNCEEGRPGSLQRQGHPGERPAHPARRSDDRRLRHARHQRDRIHPSRARRADRPHRGGHQAGVRSRHPRQGHIRHWVRLRHRGRADRRVLRGGRGDRVDGGY